MSDDENALDSIAAEIGTVTDEREETEADRVDDSDAEIGLRDVQTEYDGGWSNGSPDRSDDDE